MRGWLRIAAGSAEVIASGSAKLIVPLSAAGERGSAEVIAAGSARVIA